MRFYTASLLLLASQLAWASPWGKTYFPNTELTSHRGETVRFFDDLVEGKIVAINFIYTSCPDVCPLETAQLTRVQNILGDRVGKDVHFYSISIDPEFDTPEILAEYRARFKARWDFFTGDKAEIIELRRKLGLYVEGADSGPNKNNHNVSMIIGNQKTGRWMTRSPFENPYVLADQIGNWLDGWKLPQVERDYADAPQLRPLVRGEALFRTRCSSCHSTDGSNASYLGPDLYGVTQRRSLEWLVDWMRAPDKMYEQGDPLAVALVEQYGGLVMPNLRLNQQEVTDLLDFMGNLPAPVAPVTTPKSVADLVAVMNAWVREVPPGGRVHGGYMTLINAGDEAIELLGGSSDAFSSVEFHEMGMEGGMMQMRKLESMSIAPDGKLEFIPGGKHLMLREAKVPVREGGSVEIELQFSGGRTQILTVPIRK